MLGLTYREKSAGFMDGRGLSRGALDSAPHHLAGVRSAVGKPAAISVLAPALVM